MSEFEKQVRTILTTNAGRIPERLEQDIAKITAAHNAAVREALEGYRPIKGRGSGGYSSWTNPQRTES